MERQKEKTEKEHESEKTPKSPISSEAGLGVPPSNVEKEARKDAEKIVALEKELAEQKDKLLRTLAEFDNFRKRTYKEIFDAKINSKIDVILPFLKVYDHFQLAVKAADEKHNFDILHQGMNMILSEFSKALNELNIEKIDANGKIFNPIEHEAADQKNSNEIPEGYVIEQWRCGYKMGEKIIQPALVVVSSGAPKENNEKSEEKSIAPTDDEDSSQEISGGKME